MSNFLLNVRGVIGSIVLLILMVPAWVFHLGNRFCSAIADGTDRFVYWDWK